MCGVSTDYRWINESRIIEVCQGSRPFTLETHLDFLRNKSYGISGKNARFYQKKLRQETDRSYFCLKTFLDTKNI